jgi:ABC-type lipoprotein export system ATPase subunit
VLADEPTAALDWENGQAAIRLLVEQARAEHSLLIVVTHDTRLVKHFDRVLRMESGRIQES